MTRILALLGRTDEPTDGVEEYCRNLGVALGRYGLTMEISRAAWQARGWSTALREVQQQAASWRGRWIFLQYTALAWSVRGFPGRFVRVVQALRRSGARVGIVYHDAEPFAATRLVEKVRRMAQLRTMRRALRDCDLAVFTVPLEKLSWVEGAPRNAVFIPVGANLPVNARSTQRPRRAEEPMTVSVFSVTGGNAGEREVARIAEAVQFAAAKTGKLRLIVFGRNADSAASPLRAALGDASVELQVFGVLPAEEVARLLSSSDVLLFVRGPISSRRGSAIAGIACGIPVIASAGPETAHPITEAGVVFVSTEKRAELGEALARVLSDRTYRESLAERSRVAQEKYFAWDVIARQYAEAMEKRKSS